MSLLVWKRQDKVYKPSSATHFILHRLDICPPLYNHELYFFLKIKTIIYKFFQHVFYLKKISENKKKFIHKYNQINKELCGLISEKKTINNDSK